MSLCGNCGTIEDLPTAILGTNTDLSVRQGGFSFLMLANCDAATNFGTVKANWDAALQDQDNYRAFSQCTISGSQTETPAAEAEKIGSCGVFVKANTQRDGVVTFILREDNNSADVYKFLRLMDGRRVKFALGSCDNKSLYVFRAGNLYFGESADPESKDEYRTYTVTINYTADGTTYDLVGQTWLISDIVIP